MYPETHQSSPQQGPVPIADGDGARLTGQRSRITGGGASTADESAPASAHAITLAFIGGDQLTRGAITGLLGKHGGVEVRGTFPSATHFLASDPAGPVAVLLLDCDEDPADWWSAVSVLSRLHPRSKLVMLCRELSPEVVRCAMQHRVSGVVLKSYSADDIKAAIRYMASGRTIMPAGWQRVAGATHREQLAVSPRLRQILTLLAQGRSNEQIAAELELSPNTIKVHVRALYAQLGVRNRVEAAHLYRQMTDRAG
jgi:two-component system, NarL family, nitrate/nitrite response regulator NarL